MSLKAKIEAVIYASEEPVTLAQLAGLLGEEAQLELDALESEQTSLELDEASAAETAEPVVIEAEAQDDKKATRDRERRLRDYFRSLLDQLIADYAQGDRGLEIREVAGGFRLATKPEYHDAVRGFVKSLKPPLKLSLQALETLAVVAYKQPVTSPEISEIRGVDTGGVLGSLMARKLITTAGRKQVIGRPILYKTTKDFLLRFGLKDINELPSIEEFEKMAGEFSSDFAAAVQEEIPMEDVEPNANVHESQADGFTSGELEDEPAPVEHPADNAVIDGRISGPAPDYAADDADDPSAQEAAIQSGEETGN